MSTSGTFNYGPGAGDLIMMAIARTGHRRSQALTEIMLDAYHEANLMLAAWSTDRGPNFWATDTIPQTLTQAIFNYTLPATTIQLLSVVLRTTVAGVNQDRPLFPISTTQYQALPNKAQQGPPTQFWFDRQITPQINLFPAPDSSTLYTLQMRRWRQVQDTVLAGGVQPEVPYRFLDAFTWGVAARISFIHPPPPTHPLNPKDIKMLADEAFLKASTGDEENVPLKIMPMFNGYFR